MTIKKSLSIIFISFVFSLLLLFTFLFFIDPLEAGVFGLILFSLTFFLSLSSFLTLILIIWKLRRSSDRAEIFEGFAPAFRRAIFLSLLLILLIIIKVLNFFYWWNIALSFAFFILLEIIFSLRKKKITYLDEK